jgi:cysteinyl-tRNA synthetase
MPWWHMQDSSSVAMSNSTGIYVIHDGATELIYPHHESHVTQLIVLTSKPKPIKCWTHVGLINVEHRKMSKALENIWRVGHVLKKYKSNIIRIYICSKYYRGVFKIAEAELEKFESIHETIGNTIIKSDSTTTPQYDAESKPMVKFIMHMENNFHTPRALEVMTQVAKRRKPLADRNYMVRMFGLRY